MTGQPNRNRATGSPGQRQITGYRDALQEVETAAVKVVRSASIGDTARFNQHVVSPECDQGGGRDGRLCLNGTLLARPRDLRIRARAPKLRALGSDPKAVP
jgi:hypothetical protein